VSYSRRDFAKMAATGLALSAAPVLAQPPQNKAIFRGVHLGVQSYSFHDIPNDGQNHVDLVIRDMQACGAYSCELFAQQIAPATLTGQPPPVADCPQPMHGCAPGKGGTVRNPWRWVFATYTGDALKAARAHQKEWNETVSMTFYRDVRRKMNDAGIDIYAYNIMLPADASDLEIDRFFEAAHTLGARAINLSTRYATMQRLAPFADKHQMMLGVHGHGIIWDPEEFSTTATFERGFALSKWIRANLDIGHFTAAGEDPIAFIEKHSDRISNLHLKDRQRNHPGTREDDGLSLPWGQGDTKIKEVLLLLQRKRYNIPAFIEYEHAGADDPVTEIRKSLEFCKAVLSAA
jgi:sugar phosphate isomerase/epimerase